MKIKKILALCTVCVTLNSIFLLTAHANTMVKVDKKSHTQLTQGKLSNGFEYFIFQVPNAGNRTDIRLQVKVGSGDEEIGEFGSAHMLEHMVFQGSTKYSMGATEELRKKGWVRSKHYNAMTNYERTVYMFSPMRGIAQLSETLSVLSDMVLNPTLSPQAWEKERHVILAEWRSNRTVSRRMNQQRRKVIRRGARQVQSEILGTVDDIKNRSVAVLKAFHKRWYAPNNMKLIVVTGASDVKAIVANIKQEFESASAVVLPTRAKEYYEPKLEDGLRVSQLQDKDSGTSQVAMIFRQKNSHSHYEQPKNMENYVREHLIDNMTLSIIKNLLKNIANTLPEDVDNVVVRKADIGHHSIALGLFANVAPDGHMIGLKNILKVREQILRYEVLKKDVEQYKNKLKRYVVKLKNKPVLPNTFEEVVFLSVNKVLEGKPVQIPSDMAKIIERIMDSISTKDAKLRIVKWLNAKDKILQMQAPGLYPLTLPTVAETRSLIQDMQNKDLPKIVVQKSKASLSIPKIPNFRQVGFVRSEKVDKVHSITEWNLSNGDKVVWLKHPVAKNKVYMMSSTPMGYMAKSLKVWQSQMATQLIWQSAPVGFTDKNIALWKKKRGINLNHKLTNDNWSVSGSAPMEKIEDMFALYRYKMISPKIGKGLKSTKLQMMRKTVATKSSDTGKKSDAKNIVLFGGSFVKNIEAKDIASTTKADLVKQWERLVQQPVIYYIVANGEKEEIKALANKYLGSIKRMKNKVFIKRSKYLKGKLDKTIALSMEPRTDVFMSSWQSVHITPNIALQFSVANSLARKYLKYEMRDLARGVYSIKLSTRSDKVEGRVVSALQFNTALGDEDRMIALAESTLKSLHHKLTTSDVDMEKRAFMKREKMHLREPEKWLQRLKISYDYYGDGRYLTAMKDLSESITYDTIYKAIKNIWAVDNTRTLRIVPKNM